MTFDVTQNHSPLGLTGRLQEYVVDTVQYPSDMQGGTPLVQQSLATFRTGCAESIYHHAACMR